MKIDWSKAPIWANVVIRAKDGSPFYASQFGGISARQRVGYSHVDGDAFADMIPPHDWTLVESRTPEFEFSSYPQVGSTVTIETGGLRIWEEAEQFVGPNVKVVSTFKLSNTDMVVVYLEDENACCVFRASMCRPAKTPEQIAAEERDKAIQEMADTMAEYKCTDRANEKMTSLSTYLHDHGYRKQPTDQQQTEDQKEQTNETDQA